MRHPGGVPRGAASVTAAPGSPPAAGLTGEASVTPIGTSRTSAWEGLERAIAARPSLGPGPPLRRAGVTVRRHAARGDRRTGRDASGSTSWPGATSTTPRPGGASSTPTGSSSAWSKAGLDVSMTTSSVPGGRRVVRRDGYRVIRRAGRYSVFPRSILSGAVGRIGTGDGVVEIWNGMPFFSPVWSRSPADHLPPPRPRRDVEDGAAPGPGRGGHACSSTGSPRPSTAAAAS